MVTTASLDLNKYTNALLYFVSKCGNEHLGIMKLNKLFYYLDFISYRDRQKTVTGEIYLHLPKGPYAQSLADIVIQSAKDAGVLEHKEDVSEKFGTRNRFAALTSYDLSAFDAYEQGLLEDISQQFSDWSTDQMVAQTHSEAPWVFSAPNESLSYDNADDIDFFVKK